MPMTGVPIQPKDSRCYFMLPQAPEEAGYYVYGNLHNVPGTGEKAQYAHPNLLSVIFQVEREWQAVSSRKFGVGNISIDGGLPFDKHKSHQLGIEVDVRPVRNDNLIGQGAGCTYRDKVYDLEATTNLISFFLSHPWVRLVFFNDPRVQNALGLAWVRRAPTHDNHFHVELLPRFAL